MRNTITIIFIVILSLALYFGTIKGVVGNASTITQLNGLTAATNPFETSHERASYAQFLAITQLHQDNLPKDLADFSTPDVGYYQGKFFSYFPPGVSYFIIPFYNFGSRYNLGQLFSFASIILIAIANLILLFIILRQIFKLPMSATLAAVIIYGFGTTSWSYSNTLYQHAPTVFLMAVGVYSAWKYKQNQAYSWVWAAVVWLAYGLSIFFDYPNAILLLPVLGYLFISAFSMQAQEDGGERINFRLSCAFTILAFVAVMGVYAQYNKINFGRYVAFSNTLPRYQINNLASLQAADTIVSSAGAGTSKLGQVFNEKNIPNGLYELTIASDKGIVIFSPILLLALLGIYTEIKKRISPEALLVLLLVCLDFFMYMSFGDPWGGWAFGPRYLIPAMFGLVIFCGIALARFKNNFLVSTLAFLLFAYSAAVALLGALTTNAVPPKSEAVVDNIKYGLSYNLQYLKSGTTGSFFYNQYFSNHLSLLQYYGIIYTLLIILIWCIFFIMPIYEHDA